MYLRMHHKMGTTKFKLWLYWRISSFKFRFAVWIFALLHAAYAYVMHIKHFYVAFSAGAWLGLRKKQKFAFFCVVMMSCPNYLHYLSCTLCGIQNSVYFANRAAAHRDLSVRRATYQKSVWIERQPFPHFEMIPHSSQNRTHPPILLSGQKSLSLSMGS